MRVLWLINQDFRKGNVQQHGGIGTPSMKPHLLEFLNLLYQTFKKFQHDLHDTLGMPLSQQLFRVL
jgi:hypothetical protein